MKMLRELGGTLLSMFVGDGRLASGILIVVAMTGVLTRFGIAPPAFGGAILLLGCIVVLLASVDVSGRGCVPGPDDRRANADARQWARANRR